MFAYCLNNPENLVDYYGHDASLLAAEWGTTMWWLNFADGVLPVGDVIYWAGLGLLSIYAVITVDHTLNDSSNKQSSNDCKKQKAQAQFVAGFGSTGAPPQKPNNNKQDLEYKKEKYLERQLRKQDTDPHSIKKEYLGNKAEIAKYDLYVEKGTGRVVIVRKSTGAIVDYTHYYIY